MDTHPRHIKQGARRVSDLISASSFVNVLWNGRDIQRVGDGKILLKISTGTRRLRCRTVRLWVAVTPRIFFISAKTFNVYDRFAQLSSPIFFFFFFLRSFLEIISFNCFCRFFIRRKKRKRKKKRKEIFYIYIYIRNVCEPTVTLTLWFSRFVIFAPGGKFITNLSISMWKFYNTYNILSTRLKSFTGKLHFEISTYRRTIIRSILFDFYIKHTRVPFLPFYIKNTCHSFLLNNSSPERYLKKKKKGEKISIKS